MAIFHCEINNISRANGSSTCESAAYITGQKIYEDRTGQFYDYTRKQKVFDFETAGLSHVLLPEGVPETFNSVSGLSNAIENYELADNARCAKKEEFALPIEVTREQKIEIAQNHINDMWVKKGYAVIWSIHDIDGHNPHCHVIIINRKINERGEFAKTKMKTAYALDEDGNKIPVYETMRDAAGKIMKDENGKRIPVLDENGQPIQARDKNGKPSYKRIKIEESYLDREDLVPEARKNLEERTNEFLPDELKVDCRSLADQGIDRIPTIHEGYAARGMEARGEVSERCELNRAIKAFNLATIIESCRTRLVTLGNRLNATMEKIWDRAQEQTVDHHDTHEYDPAYDYVSDPEAIVTALSDNPLINGLIVSNTYELTKNNLTAVAQAAKCLQEHGIDSRDKFKSVYVDLANKINADLRDYRKASEKTEAALSEADKKLNARKIMNKYRGVYKTASAYKQKEEAEGGKHGTRRDARKYEKEHAAELGKFAEARQYLRDRSPDGEVQTTAQIKQEKRELTRNLESMAESFRAERMEGWDLFDVHQVMTDILGPDRSGWRPVNTLDYQVEHNLPEELISYRGHGIKSVYNPEREHEKAVERSLDRRMRTIEEEDPPHG